MKDLKGKTVGVPPGTTAHVYLIKALKANGLTTDDVKSLIYSQMMLKPPSNQKN